MNEKDKEAFVSYMRENMPFSYYQSYQCQELSTWQSACEYKQKEIEELKLEIMQIKGQRNQAEFKLARQVLKELDGKL